MKKNLFAFAGKMYKFFSLTFTEWVLLIEAFTLAAFFRLIVLFTPFRKLARFMGKYMAESSQKASGTVRYTTQKVKWAVTLVSRHTPWKSKCLVDALTAQAMLRRRKIDSTLYLGVARNREKRLIAHAWLRSGEVTVTGGLESGCFTVVAKFAGRVGG